MVNNIPDFPELEFDEATHIYRLKGVEIPSVTTVMKPLSAEAYGGIDDATLERAAGRGTAVHNAIENWSLYGIEDIAPELRGYFEGFLAWVHDMRPKIIGNECRLYMRRAEENPAYRGHKSGIVVLRGDQVIQKEGTCLYPGETLLGGWCRVHRIRTGGSGEEIFKEVSLKEYDKGQANWKTKPCTMIEKVAVSQALRSAFPKDYEGMYVAEEVSEQG